MTTATIVTAIKHLHYPLVGGLPTSGRSLAVIVFLSSYDSLNKWVCARVRLLMRKTLRMIVREYVTLFMVELNVNKVMKI